MPDDATLLRRYAEERAEDAFAELVRRHLDGVYSAALRRVGGDTHLAEDVAQQVFTALARKAAELSRHPVLTGWLYLTTRNEAANVVRSERRRKTREQEAHAMKEILSDTGSKVDWSRVSPVLDEMIDELGEADRSAVLLRFVDRRGFAEIGATLRLTEDAARMRVERALDKLRILLARRGITSTSAALGIALSNQAVLAAPAGMASTVTSTVLASATTALGPLAAALQFMTTSKLTMGVASVAVLALAVGSATFESRARQTAGDHLAAENAHATRLNERLRELRQRTSAAEQSLQATHKELAAAETPATRSPPAAPAPAGTADPLRAGEEFLARHPEARLLWDERDRAQIGVPLLPIYRLLNLSATQREEIETILLRTKSGYTTFTTENGSIALKRIATLTRPEADAQLQSLLGPEDFTRYQELTVKGPVFDFSGRLASALYRTEPLNAQQTERMMQIFASAIPITKSGSPGGSAKIDWNVVATEAGRVLSPTQLQALTGVQLNFEYQQIVGRAQPIVRTPPADKTIPTPLR